MVDQVSPLVDQRHQRRIKLMQNLFLATFGQPIDGLSLQWQDEELAPEVLAMVEKVPSLDIQIQQFAPERPLAQINRVDLAILRLIVYESSQQNTPKKVLIDEAVELAKEYGSASSPRFVNGVLGKLLMGGESTIDTAEAAEIAETAGASESEPADKAVK